MGIIQGQNRLYVNRQGIMEHIHVLDHSRTHRGKWIKSVSERRCITINNKLFVGGLSWDTTDASLGQFFAQAGTVTSASVITDKFTGKSRGFGFVEMASDQEAQTAIQTLNGQSLDGRTIQVTIARPKPEYNDRPSGGRSFGGGGAGGRDNRRGGGHGGDRNRGGNRGGFRGGGRY